MLSPGGVRPDPPALSTGVHRASLRTVHPVAVRSPSRPRSAFVSEPRKRLTPSSSAKGRTRVFDSLTRRLEGIFQKLRGQGKLTPENIKEGLREIRRALLEADVHVSVAKDFLARVEERAVGREVLEGVDPSAMLAKVVYEELVAILGTTATPIALSPKSPDRRPARRPPGLGQDHVRGEARPLVQGEGQARAAGQRRRPSPGRARAAARARRRRTTSRSGRPTSRRSPPTSPRARWPRRSTAASTCSSSTPPAA